MPIISLDTIKAHSILPGFKGKFLHTDKITLAYFEIEEGAQLTEHSHPEEQVSNILQGKFRLNVGDETQILEPGKVAVIPGGVKHSGEALSYCRVMDVFCPVREKYKNLDKE